MKWVKSVMVVIAVFMIFYVRLNNIGMTEGELLITYPYVWMIVIGLLFGVLLIGKNK